MGGAETVVDRDVRRTWQVDSARFVSEGVTGTRRWPRLVADAALGLGVSEPVAADFYKFLVYDTGSFFVDHRDTEKAPGMFATMVLVLPSTHSGGELVMRILAGRWCSTRVPRIRRRSDLRPSMPTACMKYDLLRRDAA